ncbi:MAG TPA: glycosyltransferase family 9 protein, partial [Verrucomicrobiota bacterium]|nr:glycosyltransferase family 9 protein [Verrucomicrobiota bacterium]
MAGENILLIKLSALGDVIHTLPALTTLRRHRPDARITWLAEEGFADLLRGHPALDRLIVWRRGVFQRALRDGRLLAACAEFRRCAPELRDTSYDLAVDFQGLAKSALWITLARARRKVGYGPGNRRNELAHLALTERVPVTDPGAHAVERNLRLLAGLGFPRLPLRHDLPVPPEAEDEAGALLADLEMRALAEDELARLDAALPDLEQAVRLGLLPRDV